MLNTLKPLLIFACFSMLSFPKSAFAEVQLVMFESTDCPYCARWDRDIAAVYPKTREGKIAPLLRYNLFTDNPAIQFKRSVSFTPTFVLIQDNIELGRIEGYKNDEQFWASLNVLFTKSNILLTNE